MNSNFTVDYFLASLKRKHFPDSLMCLVKNSPFSRNSLFLLSFHMYHFWPECFSAFSIEVMVPYRSHQRNHCLPPKAGLPNAPSPFPFPTAWLHPTRVLVQMPPPPWSPPPIPSHRWLCSLTLSTSPGLLLKFDYFLGELTLCPMGLCKETGVSLIDVTSLAVSAETWYVLEALDLLAKWSWSWGRLESTQTCFWYHPSPSG